jgi:hypothetical protein
MKIMAGDSNIFAKPIANMYKGCQVIDENLAFIFKELPTLSFPDDVRAEVSGTFAGFRDALHDVIAEIRILEDKLELHPGEDPNDPNVVNRDPRVTLELIEGWLSKEAETMNRLVRKLWAPDQQDRNTYILVNALVTESATNILQAVAGIKEESRFISSRLSPAN